MYPVLQCQWNSLTEAQQAQLKLLLLMADPDWKQVSTYLFTATILLMLDEQGNVQAQLCLLHRQHEAEIKNLAVAQLAQGRGLAKALIGHVVENAKALAIRTLWVKTGNSSLDQLALYQKCGFRLSHIEHDVFRDYPEPIYEHGIRCLDQVVLSMTWA